MKDNGRVNVAAAGAHDHTFQRGKPHAGVNAFPVGYRCDAASVAQVAGDQLQLFPRAAQFFRCQVADILVAGAMEAVLSDLSIAVEFMG